MKKCKLLSLLISLFVLSSCQNNEPTDSLINQSTQDSQIPSIENTTESIEDIKINESLQFYKDELIKDLNSIKESVLSNINDEDIYVSTFSLIADCVEMVKSRNSFAEAREFYDYYLSDCNSNDVENLTKKFNQVYFGYSPLLDKFVLCVDHIGTAWNCYNINFKS